MVNGRVVAQDGIHTIEVVHLAVIHEQTDERILVR